MQSRLVHLLIRISHDAWHVWADGIGDIDHRVKSFLKFKPDLLHKFDPNHQELTFPCPRTWEFLSKIIKPWPEVKLRKLPVLAGTIGQGAAREFYPYCQIFGEICTIEEILADPENCVFGDEPSMHYALMGLVSHHMTEKNANTLIKFLLRLEIDFQVVALRSAIARNRKIRQSTEISKWIARNAQELL
jgi:hypothetical protein